MADIKVPKRMIEGEDSENKQMAEQQDILIYQLMQRQLQQLGEEANMVERRMVEAAATKKSITELKSMADILMPIGSGCYVHSKFSDDKHVLVDIGANILVSKAPSEAEAFVAEKEAEMAKLKTELQAEANKAIAEMNKIASRAGS